LQNITYHSVNIVISPQQASKGHPDDEDTSFLRQCYHALPQHTKEKDKKQQEFITQQLQHENEKELTTTIINRSSRNDPPQEVEDDPTTRTIATATVLLLEIPSTSSSVPSQCSTPHSPQSVLAVHVIPITTGSTNTNNTTTKRYPPSLLKQWTDQVGSSLSNSGTILEENINNIRITNLIHLHQDTWETSCHIVQARVLAQCGRVTQRIYGRHTTVQRLQNPQSVHTFLQHHHLWKSTTTYKYAYGLYWNPVHTNKGNNHNHTLDEENDNDHNKE
jgi:hypothetical protein